MICLMLLLIVVITVVLLAVSQSRQCRSSSFILTYACRAKGIIMIVRGIVCNIDSGQRLDFGLVHVLLPHGVEVSRRALAQGCLRGNLDISIFICYMMPGRRE